MSRTTRFILTAVVSLVLLIVVAVVAIPLFLNADQFRTRIETTLSKSLGRKVTIEKLELSLLSGGLSAQNATVADDPAFSTQPFLQADNVKIRVEVLPLILHRTVLIHGISLQAPKIQLLRLANGVWNYSNIGSASSKRGTQDAETKQTFPSLTVDSVDIENGRITVGTGPGSATVSTPTERVYDQVNLKVENFGFTSSFAFSASAGLPAGGTIDVKGNAGPINQQDASATPFSGHLEMKHIDPLAAGFITPAAGISGQVDSITLDAAWSGQQMHVTKLLVASPHLTIARTTGPKQPKSAGVKPEGASMLDSLSVDEAQITNGSVTLTSSSQTATPAVYQQLNARLTNLTPTTASPFTVSAQLPGGGTLDANGKAGPFNQQNDEATPLNAQVTLKHIELGSAGILPPDAGIAGLADLQAQVQSNGKLLNATGNASVANIKLARNGQPSARPVEVRFTLSQNEQAKNGQIEQAVVSIGRAVISMAGTYQSTGASTALNLKVNGNAIPIDDLEAFLPALGVHLPQGSRLQGGSLTTALNVSGSSASPVISGPVHIENTQLAGFNLGAKLQSLSQLTGGKIGNATGSGTTIRSLSMDVQVAGGNVRTDKIALDVAGVGTATGAGTVSEAGALNYNTLLKLTELVAAPAASTPAAATPAGGGGGISGLLGGLSSAIPNGGKATAGLSAFGGAAGGVLKSGIPIAIGGTTSNPTFSPNLSRLASGIGLNAAQGLIKSQGSKAAPTNSNPLGNALGGLLGKH